MNVKKRNGSIEGYNREKIVSVLEKTLKATKHSAPIRTAKELAKKVDENLQALKSETIKIETIQDLIRDALMVNGYCKEAEEFVNFRERKRHIRWLVEMQHNWIENYKKPQNNADSTIDDNSNVANKNIGVLNAEIHKLTNVEQNRYMVMYKLRERNPDFDAKQYVRDLSNHIIYKNDESTFPGAIAPYCCSISMYPFLLNGLKDLGGLSAKPKRLASYCGIYSNLIFTVGGMFAGAVATSEFLLYFDYFARKDWGDNYYSEADKVIYSDVTYRNQIRQYFQQVVYAINQPIGARGLQSAFTNFSYFDKDFFEGMFGDFVYPDGVKPQWESLDWLQREFMQWFNAERLKTMLTFPVESCALVYKDHTWLNEDMFHFVCEEYARGHSFFTYISDTVDSLSSCCRLKNMVQTKEFNFTNGNMGVQTGSKSVITLNLSRITQIAHQEWIDTDSTVKFFEYLRTSLVEILGRVYKYHEAYNELLWDMYEANLLPVYKAGFINLNKQYLTIGLNGLNEAAEFLGMECSDNEDYQNFCQFIFSTIKEQNTAHKTNKLTFNTEQVPAESLAVKNYNWDKEDGYWVPENRNLYASYIFIPSDTERSILEKIRMHGNRFIGDYLDGGSACHLNLSEHLTAKQYEYLLTYAAEQGCNYLTFNVVNSQCDECGFIAKQPFDVCPKCGSTKISNWDRIIGYLTKISNWSSGRQIEQKTRVYDKPEI